jgi:glucose-1-phosphate cytidylyltransferase
MKAVIFAGGMGTRMGSASSSVCPKPMVEVGGMPVIFHLMNIYGHHGVTDFILCLGYMSDYFKKYFRAYFLQVAPLKRISSEEEATADTSSDGSEKILTFQLSNAYGFSWRVTLLDEGEGPMTGGRLKQASYYLDPAETFCVTYGDGLSNVDIADSITSHQARKKMVTVTTFKPRSQYGVVKFNSEGEVISFEEKPIGSDSVNIGFFVLSPDAIPFIQDFVTDGSMVWEKEPLTHLTRERQLGAYPHRDGGFWKGMDSLADKEALQKLWDRDPGDPDRAPWRVWSPRTEIRPTPLLTITRPVSPLPPAYSADSPRTGHHQTASVMMPTPAGAGAAGGSDPL